MHSNRRSYILALAREKVANAIPAPAPPSALPAVTPGAVGAGAPAASPKVTPPMQPGQIEHQHPTPATPPAPKSAGKV